MTAADYRAVAQALHDAVICEPCKVKVVKELCKTLKAADPRFDSERFSKACWGAKW